MAQCVAFKELRSRKQQIAGHISSATSNIIATHRAFLLSPITLLCFRLSLLLSKAVGRNKM